MFRREVQAVEDLSEPTRAADSPATRTQSLLRPSRRSLPVENDLSKTRQTHRFRHENLVWQPAMRLPHPEFCQYAMSTVW
jgi:hypothetical protein